VTFALILVVDGDLTNIIMVSASLGIGSFWLEKSFDDLLLGPHRLSFYLVDSLGCVSRGQDFWTTVVIPLQTATPLPSSVLPIQFTTQVSTNFDAFGNNQRSTIGVTRNGRGFETEWRVSGGAVRALMQGKPDTYEWSHRDDTFDLPWTVRCADFFSRAE
jgi:hypothetical protein